MSNNDVSIADEEEKDAFFIVEDDGHFNVCEYETGKKKAVLFNEDDANFILDLFNNKIDGEKMAALYDVSIGVAELFATLSKVSPLFTK
jgi:hypothetical protein